MALGISLCVEGNHHFPYSPIKYSPKIKCALFFDTALIATLLVVGILSIIFGGMSLGHALPFIGTIGKAWSGVMIAGGGVMIGTASLTALMDLGSHLACVAGYKINNPLSKAHRI